MKRAVVKCKLSSKDAFEKKLAEVDAEFGMVYWLHDRVYVPRGYKEKQNFPRLILRTEMRAVDRPPRYELILRRHIEDSGIDVVDATVIRDYTEAANIILQLGFVQQAEVSSRRQELVMGKATRIYLDKVEGIAGYYAKIETFLDEKDKASEVLEELRETFRAFGQTNFSTETYSELL